MLNPATRPLVKSLMKVLSFLMRRRRKLVPKAMRKQVLMLVLQMLDLKNPTEVAIATYMTKNLASCTVGERRTSFCSTGPTCRWWRWTVAVLHICPACARWQQARRARARTARRTAKRQ